MSGLGVVTVVSSGLQIVVPSYGLRLVRRFGAQSVGWFLVISFSSLALLHLFGVGRPAGLAGAALATEAIYAVGALLLLVGMGHLEAIFSERQQVKFKESALCEDWTSRIRAETAELERHNHELQEWNALSAQRISALEASEVRYRTLFEDSPQAMWVFDLRTQRILATNPAAERMVGFSKDELATLTIRDVLADAVAGDYLKHLAACGSGTRGPLRWQLQCKNGSRIDVELIETDLRYDGAPARLLVATDLSPIQKRETELRNSVRLEVIAQVAGGVAHHFNNLLTIIDGSAAMVRANPTDPQADRHLENISSAVTRAASLTRQLVSVGGKRALQLEPLDLNELLQTLAHTVRRLVGNGIVIQNFYGVGLPPVLADARLVEQALISLVLNARDAMPNGGTITINTSTTARKQSFHLGSDREVDREYVRLVVRDTGCGMSPEVLAHLFEPFFTTKDVGRGTGLGLASVYGGIKQQGGWVELSSEVGRGTEARVFLPCAPANSSVIRAKARPAVMLGTILLVEPDDRVRGMARCTLNWNGYRVIEADNCATALMLWQNQAMKVDLLLVDLAAEEGSTGLELAKQLHQAKPSLRVVCSAVASSTHRDESLEHTARWSFLAKPYNPETLLQAVQAELAVPTDRC